MKMDHFSEDDVEEGEYRKLDDSEIKKLNEVSDVKSHDEKL